MYASVYAALISLSQKLTQLFPYSGGQFLGNHDLSGSKIKFQHIIFIFLMYDHIIDTHTLNPSFNSNSDYCGREEGDEEYNWFSSNTLVISA